MHLVETPEELPPGSHSIALYGSAPEAARQMAGFLKGAHDRRQSAMVLTASDRMMDLYRGEISRRVPAMLSSLRRIPGPQVTPTADGLRPIPEVLRFAAEHPEGATMCGDTIPGLLDRRNLSSVLAYESWFDGLRPFQHRGLCPYDLYRLPVERAPEALGVLAKSHTHGVLSDDPNPGVQFLQLLVLPHVENPPAEHLGWLARAVDYGLIEERPREDTVALTPRGETVAAGLLSLPAYADAAAEAASHRRRGPEGRAPPPPEPRSRPEP
ncbi:MAG TPA: hypothetical protein VMH49_05775 [Thermoplasmata archaeon]|nr:hypothetical protein [Thermoplasmata archaeon]